MTDPDVEKILATFLQRQGPVIEKGTERLTDFLKLVSLVLNGLYTTIDSEFPNADSIVRTAMLRNCMKAIPLFGAIREAVNLISAFQESARCKEEKHVVIQDSPDSLSIWFQDGNSLCLEKGSEEFEKLRVYTGTAVATILLVMEGELTKGPWSGLDIEKRGKVFLAAIRHACAEYLARNEEQE